jgi:DNA-binding MarR family transcriptional regulator
MVTLRAFSSYEALLKLAERYPELDLASVETCLAFLNTTAEVYDALDAHFARYGLSMGKFTLLMQLLQAPDQELTPSDFAERAGVTRATITGLLDGLEREKLVKRKPHSADRRRLSIHLTPKGEQLLLQMLPDHFCRTTNLMANLSEKEKQIFIELLAKVRAGSVGMREP